MGKAKSKDYCKGQDPPHDALKICNKADGTYNDYSDHETGKFPQIVAYLTQEYKTAADKMKGNCPSGKITKVIVRQTGKIRAKLLGEDKDEDRTADKPAWLKAMNTALKARFGDSINLDYALLPNAEEAKKEGANFFSDGVWNEFSNSVKGLDKKKVIIFGVGSSSTQAYRLDNGVVKSGENAVLGAKPKKGVTTADVLPSAWDTLFKKVKFNDGTPFTAVAFNAIGYPVKAVFKKNADVAKKIQSFQGLDASFVAAEAEKIAGTEKCKADFGKCFWGVKVLQTLAEMLAKLNPAPKLILENKIDGPTLPGGASWVKTVLKEVTSQ